MAEKKPPRLDPVESVERPWAPARWGRDQTLMAVASAFSRRSTCRRLQCGAVISMEGRVLATGYNGAPSGLPHCDPKICRVDLPCTRTVHAEANAIAFAARHGIAVQGGVLHCTDSPCMDCAKLIINAGILSVVYARPYRDTSPLAYLAAAGVTHELTESIL